MDYFKTITREGTAEFKDRGSRFLAFAFPAASPEIFKERLAILKKEHPKAVHHCFAYRLGTDQYNYRVSDDGEPSGTAGKPILGQIDNKGLTDTAVIVVRYFGGTLLGVPGLINAYKTAASMALQVTPMVEKIIEKNYIIHCSYPLLNEAIHLLKQHQCSILQLDQSLFCSIKTGIPVKKLEQVLHLLNDMHGLEIKPETV